LLAVPGGASHGMSGRATAREHHVGRRTIVKALAATYATRDSAILKRCP
jgi:hypothetical protein